jgi:hypothetical protein
MTGAKRREKMDSALKEITIPFLREQGLKGSYPHFRREKDGNLKLLTFQFSLSSSRFVVEISNCPPEGFTTIWGKYLKPSECRTSYMSYRFRIGSEKNNTEYWYDFTEEPLFGNIYSKRAKEIIANWKEAESWWTDNPYTI